MWMDVERDGKKRWVNFIRIFRWTLHKDVSSYVKIFNRKVRLRIKKILFKQKTLIIYLILLFLWIKKQKQIFLPYYFQKNLNSRIYYL